MRILHIASISENKAAGVSFSVPNLIEAQNLYCKENVSSLYNTVNGIRLKEIDFNNYSLYILHSFFELTKLIILFKIPRSKKIIICPRGAFSKANKYSIKKHIYSYLYFNIIKYRKLNVGIHFLTENEKTLSRFHLPKEFVIGNTININSHNYVLSIQQAQKKFYAKEIVYIGRFANHIKGLDLLFYQIIKDQYTIKSNRIVFSFYGPESEDKIHLQKIVKENNLSFIHFYNEVFGSHKNQIIKNATFNIMSSRSEGFPMAVLESCAYSTPQILSKGTNFLEIMSEMNFGLRFSDSFISKIVQLSFNQYYEMCKNAKLFALLFDYETIGGKTLDYYKLT